MQFIVVSGMSGAGKSRAINALEDMGFYCVDNIPPKLVIKFAQLCQQTADKLPKVAIVTDARSREMFPEMLSGLTELEENKVAYKLLFLDADDQVIIHRYKETRRKHPLVGGQCSSIQDAILLEREYLSELKKRADFIVDTSLLSPAQLKERITAIFSEENDGSFLINCMSFGFKHGIPTESDLVFDVRCLPNPFYMEQLKEKTGLDEPVYEYVMSFPKAQTLLSKILDYIDYALPLYRDDEGKSQLVISIGCTGGCHRSVVFVRKIEEHLSRLGFSVMTNHRDIGRRK